MNRKQWATVATVAAGTVLWAAGIVADSRPPAPAEPATAAATATPTSGGILPGIKLPSPIPEEIPAAELEKGIARKAGGHNTLAESCAAGYQWTCGVVELEHSLITPGTRKVGDTTTTLYVHVDDTVPLGKLPGSVWVPCSKYNDEPGPADDLAREFLAAAPIKNEFQVQIRKGSGTGTAYGCAETKNYDKEVSKT